MALTNRESLVRALQISGSTSIKAKGVQNIPKGGPRLTELFFQQQALTSVDLENVLGTSDEFLKRMSQWQAKVENAMATQLRVKGNQFTNNNLLKRRLSVNLNMFNKKTADELYSSYYNDVLRMPALLRKAGAPAVELPSGNLYTSAFKFMVDQSGTYHPGREVLTSMIMNFNPSRSPLDALSISRSNILSYKTLERMTKEAGQRKLPTDVFGTLKAGQKVLTFDIETTGVFEGAQMRSAAAAEMVIGKGGVIKSPVVNEQMFLASNQLSGLTVKDSNGAVETMTRFLSRIEGGSKAPIDMGQGGVKFLDEAEKFIEYLLTADKLTGHNIGFDITKFTETIEAQSAYITHKGVQKQMGLLYNKIEKGDYLVDTLQSARSYLQSQVEELVANRGLKKVEEKSALYVKSLYANEILASVHTGGSAAYASVENIALNTNLFELIEKNDQAASLFEKISKGSHVAEVDTILQSYIGKYMHEGKLKISAVANQPITDFGRFARSMVFQSQAITPTTSIANVQHMSNTVFQTLLNKPEDIKLNISDALATKYKFKEGSGILSYIGKPSDVQIAMGIDPNLHTPGYYLLSNINQTGQQASQSAATYVRVSDQTATERMIGKILGEARKGDAGATTPIQLQTKGGAVITKKVNLEATSIIGTGWNYSQASAVNELEHIGRLNIKTTGRFTQDEAIDAFSSVFKQLGSGLSPSDQMRFIAGKDTLGSPFQAGMSNYSLDVAKSIAQKFAKIGDPFAYMSMTDRVFSTIVAESTTGLANFANASGARAGYAAADLAFTATPKVTSGLGISVFQSTTTARLLDASVSDVAVRKMILPQRILKEATAQIDPNLSMSKIYLSSSQTKQNKVMVNAVWDARRQLGETQSRSLMENIFDIMTDKQKVASLLGKDEAELDSKIIDQINFLVAQKSQGKKMQAVEEMLGSLSQEGGGIIFANAGDESANLAIALERAGFPIENANDVFLRNKYATALTTGLSEDFVALSPFIEEKATETVKLAKDAAKAATEVVDVNGKKVSRAIQSANRIAESLSSTEGGTRVLIGRLNRAKMGMGPNKMLDFYNLHKPKVGIALGAVALAGIGYYISKKHRERQLYDETLQQQPMESARQLDPNAQAKLAPPVLSLNSIRRDPLTTAGVVGNLDRAKIGHTKMGPRKDNHLFGGAI